MAYAILDQCMPLLALFGALAVVLIALVVGFWPWIESPLIAFLVGVRDWRANRRRRRDLRRAQGHR